MWKFAVASIIFLSAFVFFNVPQNVQADSSNLIPNPSVETVNPNNPATPQSWNTGRWGTNSTSFSYLNSGHNSNRSLLVQMSSYSSGDAKWYFKPVPVTPGTSYSFSDYYISNVSTEVDAVYTSSTGATSYKYLGTLPASAIWKQYSANVTIPAGVQYITFYHLIGRVGSLQTDDFSLTATNNSSSSPQVNIVSPAAGSTVSGQVNISANAADSSGVKSVQFMLDNQNVGSAITASPYQLSWDSTAVPNGPHALKAIATNTNNLSTTSAAVNITVNNPISTASNLLSNPSMETVDPNNSSYPAGWRPEAWGTNTHTYSYQTSGHSGNRSVRADITSYTSGAAYWYNLDQPVIGGQMYDYSDYYESNILSEIEVGVNMSDGSIKYIYLGQPSPSPYSWTKFEKQFTVPAGAVSINIYHEIYAVGWIATDDYSLSTFSYQGFNRPIISITDDDGTASFYTYGLPVLQKYGFNSTDYIISGRLDTTPGYMTSTMVKSLYNAGQEIGSHTVSHLDLTTLNGTQIDSELANSQSYLQNLLNAPVTDFASPFGTYNGLSQSIAAKYYQSYRATQTGYNVKNNFNSSNLLVQNITVNTTAAQLQSWIDQAKAINAWLILVYHEVNPDTSTGTYNTYPADFDSQMSQIKSSGITVETINQALPEVQKQL